MFAGVPWITGATSVTVTVNDFVEVRWFESVAVHVTVVVPTGNVEPDPGTQNTGSLPSVASVAVGLVNVTTAPAAEVAGVVIFDGTPLITGGLAALVTVTVNDVELLFPFASVAVQVTVVVPIGNVEPDGGTQLTGSVPSTTSVAVGFV
jgi:hypothetical protein